MSHSTFRTSYHRTFGTPVYSPVSSNIGGRYISSSVPTRSVDFRSRSSAPAPRLSYDKVDFSSAEAVNQEFFATRSNEKRELQELNDRFASFIEKVRYLEQQNSKLILELGQYKDQQQGPSGRINELCQQEMRELRRQLELMGKDRDQMQVERDNLAEDVALLKQRCVCWCMLVWDRLQITNKSFKKIQKSHLLVIFKLHCSILYYMHC